MEAFYHSVVTFGTVDGPGIRYVLFLNGCNLACSFCHNPDTWKQSGQKLTVNELLSDYLKYKTYYDKSGGGLTISGGEPLLQANFVAELFKLCQKNNIHTALDTSGFAPLGAIDKILPYTNLVMFSLKAFSANLHFELTGQNNQLILQNLQKVINSSVPLTIRYVIIPELTDTKNELKQFAQKMLTLPPYTKIELLAYHSLGKAKWDALGYSYQLTKTPEATPQHILNAKNFLLHEGLTNKFIV